jgi:hypothetical protein
MVGLESNFVLERSFPVCSLFFFGGSKFPKTNICVLFKNLGNFGRLPCAERISECQKCEINCFFKGF